MKSLFTLAVSLFAFGLCAQNVIINDAKFKQALLTEPCATLVSGSSSVDVDANDDGEIQLSEAEAVSGLALNGKQISDLTGIDAFKNLESLNVSYNSLTTLNLNSNTKLRVLFCFNDDITSLDLSNLPDLEEVHCSSNEISALLVPPQSKLTLLNCSYNLLTTLELNNLTALKTLNCSQNDITQITLQGLGELQTLDCTANKIVVLDLTELPKLKSLFCGNNSITNLNFTANPDLKQIECFSNKLTSLNLSGVSKLTDLNCYDNTITNISNIESNTQLVNLDLRTNLLSSLSLPKLPKLEYFRCDQNQILVLQLDSMPYLRQVWCANNNISQLDLSKLPALQFLNCDNNFIQSLDFRHNFYLTQLSVVGNKLVTVNLKNGSNITTALFLNNPDLVDVCCDLSEIIGIKNLLQFAGLGNVAVNDYCYIPPGGVSYLVEGQVRFDTDNNNCTNGKLAANGVKIQIPATNNTPGGYVLPNKNYQFYLPEGSYNIPVQPTAPALFQVEPTQFQVTFPGNGSTYQQNFCLKPIGVQHDVSISLIPDEPLRPGFVSRFLLVYQNNGNQTSEGEITVNFDDNRLDFQLADVTPNSINGGTLKWQYSGLEPLESKLIILQFRCNSPADNPAVNSGDLMSFSGGIDGIDPDKTFPDNFINLRLTVVGSYDPNDKTCLQGERLDPAMVGEYVHYRIRFENTGTYPAEFIVVRDTINTAVFDINTLEILAASHPMYTRIVQGNLAEFIFEDINLPFDDANNDGYVSFRIKTRDQLKIGDKLENRAAIYFDYNLPIITNTTQTVIAPLVDTDAPGDPFALRMTPNPATNRVYFQSEAAIERVSLSSTEGRLLYSGPLTNSALSLENVAPGMYWVRVYTEKQVQVLKLIKS